MEMVAMWRLRWRLLLQTGGQVLLHAGVQMHVGVAVTVAVMVGSSDVWRWPGGMNVVLHVWSSNL